MLNSQWTRDELILALDLYLLSDQCRIAKDDSRIVELSQILRSLPIHPARSDDQKFRSPAGVHMKLKNFLAIDPESQDKGLSPSSGDTEVWDEFANDRDRLRRLANAIKQRANTIDRPYSVEPAVCMDESFEAPEGRIIYYEHKLRERNSSLVDKKKKLVLSQSGDLICEACGFSFRQRYGDIGYGFIECHHNKPVSEMMPGDKTSLEDLSIVCANCHRMLHTGGERLTVDALRRILSIVGFED